MKIICIDDEKLILDMTVMMCRRLPEKPEVIGFYTAADALQYMQSHNADIALLDINMPDMNGMMLAARLKEFQRNLAIIFLTGHAEYAVEAFSMHVSGYLLKPINMERLAAEIHHAAEIIELKKTKTKNTNIFIRTFGDFDVLVDGKPIAFARSKSKELLAYLVDRRGGNVTRPEVFSVLWEGKEYTRSMQKQLDVVLRSLRTTLSQYHISSILEMGKNGFHIIPETFDCDIYRFYDGDVDTINAYQGEYMSSYSWASITEADIDDIIFSKNN